MDKAQIVDIIKNNPELPYEEVRRQSVEAGLSREDFDGAWVEANPDQKGIGDHDRRVKEIQKETKRLGKETKTREEWKTYFKAKGYLDDECDLAYVLEDAKINYGPLPPKLTIFLLVLLGIGIAFVLGPIMGSGSSSSYRSYSHSRSRNGSSGVVYLASAPVLGYIFYLRRQFQKYSWRIMEADFKATLDPAPSRHFSDWKKAGAEFLGRSDAKITTFFETTYDNRLTHFGTYMYSEGSGKHRHTVECFLVVQETKTQFPHVLCRRPSADVALLRNSVQLEGIEFNKQYKVYADSPTDAFYMLNPRIMSALLDKGVLASIKSFETVGDLVVMIFGGLPLDTGVHFSEPVVRFKDYESIKGRLLAQLDVATNLNDVLSREIVDDGSKRSEAKIL